jgi:hypothetical protein
MTLMDAPKYNEALERRKTIFLSAGAGLIFVLLVAWWLVAGRPIAWPWYWNNVLFGRITVNKFLKAVEADDMPKAYGIWFHDANWQQHPNEHSRYPYSRFLGDWGPGSPDNEYGVIRSHKVAVAAPYGNGALVASLINGRKSDALNLGYDPKTKELNFAPEGVQLCLPDSTDPGCRRR